MRSRKRWIGLAISALALTLSLVGCGGGGSSSSGVDTSQQVSMFATDDLNTGYDHVWVRIYQVEVETAGGSTTVFNSDAGVEVDLRSLNSGAGNLFQFLGVASFPSQDITKVNIKLDKSLVIYSTGATTGTSLQFDAAFDGSDGKTVLAIMPSTALNVASGGAVAFDFDLSAWTTTGGFVTPVANVFSGTGLDDPANHVDEDFSGTVSDLSGSMPTLTMKVAAEAGFTAKVETTADTVFLNSDGSPSPSVSDGAHVEVRGKFIVGSQTFRATVVKIEDGRVSGEAKVKGLVRNGNAAGGHFEVKAVSARGFLPSELWVKVKTSSSTKFFNNAGVVISSVEFYASISTGSAEAEGSYNSGTNTLTATKVKLEDGAGGNVYQEAKGSLITSSSVAGTLSISMTEWEGFGGSAGATLNITTDGSTTYKDVNGATITKTEFFAQVSAAAAVKVEGTYSGGTISAKRLELKSSAGTGGAADIHGYISNINVVAKTFTVTLVEWSGFAGEHGATIEVSMAANATYRNDDGETLTVGEFFNLLVSSPLVEVEGTVSGSTMTGSKAKLDDH